MPWRWSRGRNSKVFRMVLFKVQTRKFWHHASEWAVTAQPAHEAEGRPSGRLSPRMRERPKSPTSERSGPTTLHYGEHPASWTERAGGPCSERSNSLPGTGRARTRSSSSGLDAPRGGTAWVKQRTSLHHRTVYHCLLYL